MSARDGLGAVDGIAFCVGQHESGKAWRACSGTESNFSFVFQARSKICSASSWERGCGPPISRTVCCCVYFFAAATAANSATSNAEI